MLSRVAERLYWIARYLERTENTARLVDVYDKLLYDLPRGVDFDWYQLVTINSSDDLYSDRYKVRDERNVVKFLLGDTTNPSSVYSCLTMIRENARTTRDVIPADAWEMVNETYAFVHDDIQQGINRSKRYAFLDEVIKSCQQINGLLHTVMPRDSAWDFMQIGRKLERADMTSRLMDAASVAHMQMADDDTAVNSRQLIWGNVLRSLHAHQSYLRTTRSTVSAARVVAYLLFDPHFPASIMHCLSSVHGASEKLPHSGKVCKKTRQVEHETQKTDHIEHNPDAFRDYLNDLQLGLGDIHTAIAEQWFPQYE